MIFTNYKCICFLRIVPLTQGFSLQLYQATHLVLLMIRLKLLHFYMPTGSSSFISLDFLFTMRLDDKKAHLVFLPDKFQTKMFFKKTIRRYKVF